MSIKKRLLSILVIAIIQPGCYELTNRLNSGGTAVPETWLDKIIPVWPIWSVMYLLLISFWSIALIYMALKMEERLYRAAFTAAVLTIVPAMTIFILWPNYIIRPELVGSNIFTRILQWVYNFDSPYNALPSGHMYMTILTGLYFTRWYPKVKWWMVLITILMIPSTLFTKQHVILDLIAATVLAIIADRLAMWWVFKHETGRKKENLTALGC